MKFPDKTKKYSTKEPRRGKEVMKPKFVKDVKNEGNLTGEGIEFTLDESSLAHLQSLLSDLYSNRELATLRELATNALDAHVENGYEGPIEISLPTTLSPTLTIEDHGIGMDMDDFKNIYTKYAASTKRETDTQVGTLGLGSKAPLALADSFSIRSVKNGIATSAVVHRNEKNIGELQVVDVSETREPSGTVINIPIDNGDISSFEDAARSLFRFWEKGTVLVDGSEPEQIESFKISDTFEVSEKIFEDYLIMGNIPYPISIPYGALKNRAWNDKGGIVRGWSREYGVIMRVSMGAVDFTPSREALNYTERTLSVLFAARDGQFEEDFKKYIADKIQKAQSKTEAFRVWSRWNNSKYDIETPNQWRGKNIPSSFKTTSAVSDKKSWMWENIHEERRSRWGGYILEEAPILRNDDFKHLDETLFVHGYRSPAKPTAVVKKKTLRWLEDNNLSENINRVLFLEYPMSFSGWYKPQHFVDFGSVKAVKLPQLSSKTQKDDTAGWETFHISILSKDNPYIKTETSRETSKSLHGNIIYVGPSEVLKEDREIIFQRLLQIADNEQRITVCLVPKNQTKRFTQENPQAVYWHDWIETQIEKFTSQPYTYEERVVWNLSEHEKNNYANLNLDNIDDPELVKFIKTLKVFVAQGGHESYTSMRMRKLKLIHYIEHVVFNKSTADTVTSPEPVYAITENYPLLACFYFSHLKENAKESFYLYLNAEYNKKLYPGH